MSNWEVVHSIQVPTPKPAGGQYQQSVIYHWVIYHSRAGWPTTHPGAVCARMAHHHHDHALHHGHQAPQGHDRAFAIGTALNLGFVAAELVFGLAANSMALLADAAHNLGDVLGLMLGWGAAWLTRRPPTGKRTYGWGRSSILAALLNATILLIGVGAIGLEAVQRLLTPAPVDERIVVVIAAAGIVVNGLTALLFMRGRGQDINIRAQFLHMATDAAVSASVVVAGALILVTGWLWLDPVVSLGIGAVIVYATWGLLRQSADLAMDAVPEGVSQDEVEDFLASIPGVRAVHDLHIWGLSTSQTALTAHLVCADSTAERTLHDVTTVLRDRFGIGHATLQIETDADAAVCRLRPHDVV
ncbi:MAG TPA: cation diffusion facilitator family transporter [Acetobacteraceae bacterium]|nr:cation diffusion facilitator family transporter [Acetobacteraceae bacterium]